MSKKKVGIVIGAVVAAAAITTGGLYWSGILFHKGGNPADKVYVESVATIMGAGIGGTNRFNGVVEPQDSWEVKKDEERTVSEVFVEVGDVVAKGDKLFSYDVEEVELQIEQQKLELEGIDNEISSYNSQIAELQREKATVPAEMQLEYTTQIQELQLSVKQAEYDKKGKQAELEKTEKSIKKSVVTSKIDGVVKTINDTNTGEYDYEYEGSSAYMTILATGDYRVKGTVNEQNIGMLTEDMPVIIRSRVDEDVTWNGTIAKIDTENTVENNNNYYYEEGGDDMLMSTKYPFYVALDAGEDLMLGQHVYIEPDFGQQDVKEGIWLYSYYIVMDEDAQNMEELGTELYDAESVDTEPATEAASMEAYVWVANEDNELEKRTVQLGEYDMDMDMYEIKSGLTEEDMITFPMPGLYEGITTVTNMDEIDYNSPLYQMEDSEMMFEDDMYYDTEMMYEDMYFDTEMMYEDMYFDTEMMEEMYFDTEMMSDEIIGGSAGVMR